MKLGVFIFFLLFGLTSFSQSKSDLLHHLYKNKLFREYDYVLKYDTLGVKSDSLTYFRILNDLKLKQNSEIIKKFELADKLIISDTNYYIKLNLHFLQLNDSIRDRWFGEKIKLYEDTLSKQFKNFAKILHNEKNIDTNLIPNELNDSYKEYVKYQSKKPIVSAMYSVLLPGLGKLYNGRKYSFRNVFAAHLLLGGKFAESIYILGIYHPYSFLTLGFLSTYYLANIVGSYFDLAEVKKEKQIQFILHVQDFYLHNSTY